MAYTKEPVDLDSCAREPVHLIGHIQPHGLLFALSEPDFIVQHVSDNVATVIGRSPDELAGISMEAVLGARQFETFRLRALAEDLLLVNPLVVQLGKPASKMNCVAYRHDGMLVAEFEFVQGAQSVDTLTLLALAVNTQALLSGFREAADIDELCGVAADAVREASGFDRVLIYRFDADWNGEVVAAAVAPGTVSYLGHHFPASDMPAQSRQLFLTNRLRAIADANSTQVPIVPELGPAGKPLDLTRSYLRSASPIHLEFLRNWGVGASMTMSIVVEERLWGMIACHHPAPRRIDCPTRSVCELIGQNLGLQVDVMNSNAARHARRTCREVLDAYVAELKAAAVSVNGAPLHNPRFLELLDADGLIARLDGVASAYGVTVTEDLLLPILGALRKFAVRGIASSNTLGTLDQRAESYANDASGALYVGLSAGDGDYLLFLRKELIQTVSWAGEPTKAVNADDDGKLHPRKSFAAWRETLRGRSRPWTDLQLESARSLHEQLLDVRMSSV